MSDTLIGKALIIIAYLEILSVVTEVLYTFTAIVHYWQTPLKRARLSQICQNIVFCTDRIYEMKISTIVLRYAPLFKNTQNCRCYPVAKKNTGLFGNFSQKGGGSPIPKTLSKFTNMVLEYHLKNDFFLKNKNAP